MFMRKHPTKNIIFIILSVSALTLTACGRTLPANEPIVNVQGEIQTEEQPILEPEEQIIDLHDYDFTITFAGDISLADNGEVMPKFKSRGEVLSECIDETLLEKMQSADILWINNEFVYSDRGTPLEGKMYTFRAEPSHVELLNEMGVDIVGLANNHVYDFGKDAMLDTFSTLEEANIPYVGAGKNISEASAPKYMEIQGKTIAFVAASRAEKLKMTPQATETEPGILRCYDNTLFLESIALARDNADFVIALPHWGTEYSTTLEQVQIDTSKEYIDAGADAVIGAHTHCLQGFDYYNNTPIAFSLGNYWFNSKTLDTMLLNLHFYGNDETQSLDVYITPALQSNYTTTQVYADDALTLFRRLEDISLNAHISDDGFVLP